MYISNMITVVVPSATDVRIDNLVRSIMKSTNEECKGKFRIILALNKPSAAVMALAENLVKLYPKYVTLEMVSDRGIALAKNYVINKYYECSDFFAFIDSDCEVASDYLAKLVSYLEEKGSLLLVVRGSVKFYPLGNNLMSRLNSRLRGKSYEVNPCAALSPNLIVSKEVFQRSGVFSPAMKYGEDMEFCQRMESFGFKVVLNPDLVVYHQDDPSFFGKTVKTMWGYGKDRAFRVSRNIRLNGDRYSLAKKVKIILGFQKYWSSGDWAGFLFSMLYLFISRTSTVLSVIGLSFVSIDKLLIYPTVKEGWKTLRSIRVGEELP